MIHGTCPCCGIDRPPHRHGCTFAIDCPEACEDFDYVASLRLTDEEREAVEVAAEAYASDHGERFAATLRKLLERLG